MEKTPIPYIHRDISWLSFNYRVLQEAKDPSVPLFERIKFLGIYSSNLDEFFRVRVASLRSLQQLGKKTRKEFTFNPEDVLAEIQQIVKQQQLEFSEIYQKQILPQLQACGVHILRQKDLNIEQTDYLDRFFEEELIQYLQPILIIQGKIRAFLLNNALYMGVTLGTKGNTSRYAVVRVPTHHFSRFIELPPSEPHRKELIILDDVVRYYLPSLFPGYIVKSAHSIKMTRDAELHIEDEYSGDLIEKIKNSLAKRNIGRGTRFVHDRKMPKAALNFFKTAFNMKNTDLQPEGRYHNNVDWFKFPDFGLNHLKDTPLPPLRHPELTSRKPMFDLIAKKDYLVHFPYHRYHYVIKFLEQAALDPDVTEIKITQYRVAKESQVVYALRSALEEGKKVTVFVEVKARFDEEANLYWAEKLEEWGADVLYSLPELKVHAKLALVTRKEGDKEKSYVYLSTGNFNENTARIYGDLGLFTAHKGICKEVIQIFKHLKEPHFMPEPFEHILAGRSRMRKQIHERIKREIANAKAGKKAWIDVKMNSLENEKIIKRLYEANNAGVKIRIIVRGICCLVPGIPGFSENIEIISVVDRFLEHIRAFTFCNDGDPQTYLSSADWMTRNLYHRIECTFPLYDKNLKQEWQDIFELQWKDNMKARIIDKQQANIYKRSKSEAVHRSQFEIYDYYKNKLDNNNKA